MTLSYTAETDSEGYTHITGDGFSASYTLFDGEDIAYVESIFVDADRRGNGLGTTLLRQLAKEIGAVYVAPCNEDSKRLYERIGYDAVEDDPSTVNNLGLWALDQGFGLYVIY